MKHLENKVALVTGGSRGMGAAIVKQLAEEGANVAFTYVRSAEKARQLAAEVSKSTGQMVLALAADNASDTAVTAAVEEVASKLGGIDILVNNAGIYEKKPLEEQTAADYDEMMDINVKAVYMASITAMKHMKAGGRIISIGSNMADRVAGPGATLYATSKAALKGFTKGLARELGPKGITVNLVQPGPIDTDMNPANSAHADMVRSMMALQHYGHVSDIAGIVSFLASPKSGFITGAFLTIDGGFSI
ncbi:SDR family NAD(P)-dependent oxidoreductase [Chitinophaga filiformis]|uniref:3-oxoacyl-[acyl-carrier protein] reductase n=1 Tax=Chitinophaga filiformis TaxID=104663 RepID=A0A1G8D8G1_CHIFI|nr:3-oxoacyl-ACP reductase family protein [Chitinophaga filiformis]SDH53560.1 3-oxoacyl-[acyl-carrier protein] reductase [Chitinophaga filiformis]